MYCVRCGVRLEDSAKACPLCGTPVWNPEECNKGALLDAGSKELYSERIARSSIRVNRNKYLKTTGFVIVVAMLASLIVNLCVSGNLSWAKFVLLSLVEVWAAMTIPVRYAGKKPVGQTILLLVLVTSVYLFFTDWFAGFRGWSVYAVLGLIVGWIYGGLPFVRSYRIRPRIRVHLSFCMLATAVLLFAYDLMSGNTGFSLYTTMGLACAWCYILLPLLTRDGKYRIYGILLADYAITFLTVILIFRANGLSEWNLTFALSLITLLLASVCLILAVSQMARFSLFGILATSFVLAAIFLICLNLLINRCFFDVVRLDVYSIATAACLIPVAVFLYVLEKSKRLQEIIIKRFFL